MNETKKNSNNNTKWAIILIAALGIGYLILNNNWHQSDSLQPNVEASSGNNVSAGGTIDDASSTTNAETNDERSTEKQQTDVKEEGGNESIHKKIEVPAYLTDRPEEVVSHTAYTVSFNRNTHLANWVAWQLTERRSRAHAITRYDWYDTDPDVMTGRTASFADYKESGYDRGHMCPAADNKESKQAMVECFYMSNICPQTYELNHGDWEELESLCRRWARTYGNIYIVCGPIINKEERYSTIGRTKVAVPKQFFKVVMRVGLKASQTTSGSTAEGIGFVFDNDDVSKPLKRRAMSIDQVEELTGINFFSKLPREVERRAEAAFSTSKWSGL